MKIFIASKVQSPEQRLLNEQIHDLCVQRGFEVYLPQKNLPLHIPVTPREVLEANERAVDEADIAIVVFDRAEAGTAMELERAFLREKEVIGYRTEVNDSKMLQGAWDKLPDTHKAASLNELRMILSSRFVKI